MILRFIFLVVLFFGSTDALAEEFRAECLQTLSITQRGTFEESSNSYSWDIEEELSLSNPLTYLVLLDLPNRELDWIEVFEGQARSSSFSNGEENPFSIVLGDADMDVIGERLSFRNLEDPSTEWTFVLNGTATAKLRRTSSNNTLAGTMIVVDHADCSLSGTSPVILRSKDFKPTSEFAEQFWADVEAGLRQQGEAATKDLKHTE